MATLIGFVAVASVVILVPILTGAFPPNVIVLSGVIVLTILALVVE